MVLISYLLLGIGERVRMIFEGIIHMNARLQPCKPVLKLIRLHIHKL